jgi:membrane protein
MTTRHDGRTQEPKAAPTAVGVRGLLAALRRMRPRIKELNLALLAAGVAFWGTLSIFPLLIGIVTVYGLVRSPQDATDQINSALSALSPDVRHAIGDQVASVAASRQTALSFGLVLSILVLLWAASSGAQNLITALTTAFEQEETRGFVRRRAVALALALGALVVAAVLILLAGVVPAAVHNLVSVPALRWAAYVLAAIVMLVVLIGVVALLYRVGPANRPAGWRWASAGAVVTSVVLLLFTAAFAVYVNLFAHYQKTYGALAGAVILMLWLYYSTYVVLLGALLDAEAEREVHENAPSHPEGADRDVVRAPTGAATRD